MSELQSGVGANGSAVLSERGGAPTSSTGTWFVFPFPAIVVLFVASGATGLIDQVCFSKYLGYIVGSTAYAVSAVLAAFMTGLALGAYLGGRATRWVRRPLVAYGVAELVVAATVTLSPLAFEALTPLYVALARRAPDSIGALSLLRWSLATLVVIVPTIAMGATLPLVARALDGFQTVRKPLSGYEALRRRELRLAALYAANTSGGALGALSAAYFVLPALGLSHSLWASAALSALIGVVAIVGGRSLVAVAAQSMIRDKAATVPLELQPAPPRSELVLLTLLALASGWLVFAAEVVATHLLALIIGNSAYAFGLILAVFLGCLFGGAALATRLLSRLGTSALPASMAAAGLAMALTVPLWDELPLLFLHSGRTFTSFAAREAIRAMAALLILIVPITLMGLTFPLLLGRVARYRTVGELVGRLTAVNTVGAVAGALATGYLLLSLLGSQGALLGIGIAYALAAVVTAFSVRSARRMTAIALAATLLFVAVVPRWNLMRLTSGANVYFEAHDTPQEILMLREDVHGGVTSVTREHGVLTLLTNGKFQGNTGWEMQAQRLFAHYPSLFITQFDAALVIGLGTGTTLGTLASYPWRRLDVVEISPSIVEAAASFFEHSNRGVLDDPRVNVELADGRNFLLITEQKYDFIGMELSSIWFAGAASLYSSEYYALVRRHLKPGGVFQQWVQLHHIYPRDFATIMNTLRREFRHVALFYGGGQGIVVASERPLRGSLARLAELQSHPAIASAIPNGRRLEDLVDDVLVADTGLDGFLENEAREAGVPLAELVSTDDNLYLEYATPKGNVLPWSARDRLVSELHGHRDALQIDRLIRRDD